MLRKMYLLSPDKDLFIGEANTLSCARYRNGREGALCLVSLKLDLDERQVLQEVATTVRQTYRCVVGLIEER